MKKVIVASILSSMIIFNGCGDTTEENNCGVDVSMLSGDNPLITLQGDTEIEIPLGTTEVLADDSFCAYDPQDGDLSQSVVRTNNIDFSRAGVYQVTYTVEDSDGFTDTKYRTVTIVDSNNNNSYGLLDPNNDSSISGGGEYIDNSNLGEQIGESNDIVTFTSWYYNTCGGTFDSTLYDSSTNSYSGKIDCSNKSLDSIDLTQLSMFSSIDTIDLSHNNLTNIDFTPIKDIQGLNYLYINNNTATLKKKYDTVSKRNALFRFFTNLHGGDGKTGLFIGFKPHQQDSDKETLRVNF
jgi:hypothetical protein